MLGLRNYIVKSFAMPDVLAQQTRNTFILKRRYPPPLHKKGGRPGKMRSRHFIYDLVEDTNMEKQPNINIILKQYVEGAGNVGDILSIQQSVAYRKFLLPGFAVYATPENKLKYAVDEEKPKTENLFSSPYVQRTMNCLSRLILQITMSKLEPWTLEPWHIKASFRKSGYVVPENCIEMPPGVIKGPDLTLQEKEFFVTVKINNREKVNVRCRIHHWATGLDRLPWTEYHWKIPLEPLFPEQAEILQNMPLIHTKN